MFDMKVWVAFAIVGRDPGLTVLSSRKSGALLAYLALAPQ